MASVEQHQLMSQQGPHFSSHCIAKTNDNSPLLRKSVSCVISEVAIISVYPEKTRLMKLMKMNSGIGH